MGCCLGELGVIAIWIRWGGGFEERGVAGGHLEGDEELPGASGAELPVGDGGDDEGEGGLNGSAVWHWWQLEVAVGGGQGRTAALVEMLMEVAPDFAGKGWGLAAVSVGLEMAAEWEWHACPPGDPPPITRV